MKNVIGVLRSCTRGGDYARFNHAVLFSHSPINEVWMLYLRPSQMPYGSKSHMEEKRVTRQSGTADLRDY